MGLEVGTVLVVVEDVDDYSLELVMDMDDDTWEVMEERDYHDLILGELREMQVEEHLVDIVFSEARITYSDDMDNGDSIPLEVHLCDKSGLGGKYLYRTEHQDIANKSCNTHY